MQEQLSHNLYRLLQVPPATPCALAAHTGVLPFVYEIAPEEAYRRTYELAMAQDAVQMAELAELREKLAAAGIPAVPLKGCVLKPLYPGGSHMRTMCDLDILCRDEDQSRVRELMLLEGYRVEEYNEHYHDAYSKEPFLHVEIHRALVPETEQAGKYYADHDIWNRVIFAEGGSCDLPPEDHYLFIVAHFASHLLERGGSSLRGLLDIYLYRQAVEMDASYVRTALAEMGLLSFEEKYLRMAQDLFAEDGPKTEGWQEELAEMLETGMLGTTKQLAAHRREEIGGSRLHYIWRRLFPSYRHMCKSYPSLKRHPVLTVLLPVYYVRRVLTLPRHRAELKAELAELKSENKNQ